MSKFSILYLDPTADERDIDQSDVLYRETDSLTLDGSFAGFPDYVKDKVDKEKRVKATSYMHATRVIQIEQRLFGDDKKEALHKYRNHPITIVYYWKVSVEVQPDKYPYVHGVSNPGKKPFGFECVVVGEEGAFTVCYTPQFAAKIYIPTWRILSKVELDG